MEKRIVVLDSQRLDAICACPRLYSYKFGTMHHPVGYAPLQSPDYQERGSLQHRMLEPYYQMRKHRSRWSQNKRTYRDVVNSCITIGRHAGNKMHLDIAEIEAGIETFNQYATHWENDGWDNILGVEEPGAKILYDDDQVTILYEVLIDLILGLQNAVVPVDHKTAKSHRDPNELGNQFKGYCWFLGCNNIMVNEIGFQKTYEPVKKFQRHLLCFPQDIIDEWVEQSVYWVMEALRWHDTRTYMPNFTSCDKYSGCEFKSICISERSVREYKLRSNFQEKHWDVGANKL